MNYDPSDRSTPPFYTSTPLDGGLSARFGTSAGGATVVVPANRTPQSGPAVLGHLPATTMERAHGGSQIFSTGLPPARQAGAAPQAEWSGDWFGLTPKQCLHRAMRCIDMLRSPIDLMQQAEWLDHLGDCLPRLGCDQLSLKPQWALVQDLRRAGKDADYAVRLGDFLGRLDATLQHLAQVHPGLGVPDIATPVELEGFVLDYLALFALKLQNGQVPLALEFLDAIRDAGLQLDPGRTRYPVLFQALRELTDTVWNHQPWKDAADAVRRAAHDAGLPPPGASPQALQDLEDLEEADLEDALEDPDAQDEPDASPGPSDVSDIPHMSDMSGTASGTAHAQPGEWLVGSRLSEVQQLLTQLDAGGTRVKHGDKVDQVMARFRLSRRPAQCVVAAVLNHEGIAPAVQALHRNVKTATPLVRVRPGVLSRDALNILVAWQEEKAQGVRPIPAPTATDFAGYSSDIRQFLKIWAGLFWEKVDIRKVKAPGHAEDIKQLLENTGALESRGVYMRLAEMFEKGMPGHMRSEQVVSMLNGNSHLFKIKGGGNCCVTSEVAVRHNPPCHRDVEDAIMAVIRNAPAGTVFNAAFFGHMDFTTIYIYRRLDILWRRGQLVKVDGLEKGDAYCIAPPDADPAIYLAAPMRRTPSKAPSDMAGGQATEPKKSRPSGKKATTGAQP